MKNRLYILPNALTAFSLSCGLFVIFRMSMYTPEQVTGQALLMTALILLLAALADLLDGAVARAMKAESEFGGLFDSMADGITFGVAPSVVILKSVSSGVSSDCSSLLPIAAMIYVVCGVLRLVRFNVMSHQAKGNEEMKLAQQKHFTGLPIPAAAAAVVSTNLVLADESFRKGIGFSDDVRCWVTFSVLIFIGYLMVINWKFPSLKSLHVPVASFKTVLGTVLIASALFYGLFTHFALVFALFSWAYIVLALVLSIIRLISGKKSKTLIDFEPESEDQNEDD